jgi:protein-S-isoprenylcysteine O-methyltransferase Ste14
MILNKHLRFAMANVLLGGLYYLFLLQYWKAFLEQPRLSHLLVVVVSFLCCGFAMVRKDPQKVEHSPLAVLATTGGTFMPLALVPAGSADIFIMADILQIAGIVFQVAALVSLNRSFGTLPAYREIKSSGCYRYVRHPLYFAYTIDIIGFVINNPGAYNIAVMAVGITFQVLRIHYEEGVLFQYPDYARYAVRTKWRLIPLVW